MEAMCSSETSVDCHGLTSQRNSDPPIAVRAHVRSRNDAIILETEGLIGKGLQGSGSGLFEGAVLSDYIFTLKMEAIYVSEK
jgi:hypothetical protein